MLSIQSSARVAFLAVLVGAAAALLGAQPAGAQFTANDISTNATSARGVFAADVDGDGDTDVLSASFGNVEDSGGEVAWYENDESQSGWTARPINSLTDARSVFAADVDGDGDTDVLSASSVEDDNDKVVWYENDGSPSDGGWTTHNIRTDADDVRRVHAADVDGDNDIDVLSAEEDDNDIFWYENDGTSNPSFTNRKITSSASGATSVFTADVNDDGNTDVLATAEDGDGLIVWYENDGSPSNGGWTTHNIGSLSGAATVYAADLDGDGDPDVIAGNWHNNETPRVVWHENDGTDSFGSRQTIYTEQSGADESQRDVHAADVDGDGHIDVLAASQGDNTIAWYENDGSNDPSFYRHDVTTNGDNGRGVFTADVDGDGLTDVLSAEAQNDKIAWHENDVAIAANDDTFESSAPCNSITSDATSVSGAISLASSGQKVQVCPGGYSESTLNVNRQVTFESGADLTITDELTLSNNDLDVSSGTLTLASSGESSSARISGSGSGTISGDVTVKRHIDYESADADHWRFMAAPVYETGLETVPLDDSPSNDGTEHDTYSGTPLLSNMWTQGAGMTGANYQGSGADASVFYYDETASVGSDASNGWASVSDLSDPASQTNVEDGEGFAVRLFHDRNFDGSNEDFPIVLSATGGATLAENDAAGNVTLPVSCNDNDGGSAGSDGCADDFDGWNLVANPFVSHIDWSLKGSVNIPTTDLDDPGYIYDADNDQYQLTDGTNGNGGDAFIAPFQAFFVKANASDGNEDNVSLSVNSGAKADPISSDDREFKSTASEPLVSLQLSDDGSGAEETRITYRDGADVGKDRFDGYQLTPLSGTYHVLASEMEGREALFDSQYRPAPTEQDTIDLALDITEGGTYTLETDTLQNLPGDWKVILENTDSGARWDLGAGESISFEVEGTQSKSTAEARSPAELLKDGPTVAKASTDGDLPSYRLYVGPTAALPVELASFDARAEGTEVQLSWQTASETGNAGFAVERRAQDGSWSQVGFREGAGTTEQAQTYRFTDTGVPFEAEQVRYRLQKQDLDGSTTLSDEVTAQLGSPSKARLHAPFPNPAQQQATLRYEVPERLQGTSVEIALYNTLGQRVRTVATGPSEAGRTERSLDVSGLSSGTYFLRMRAGSATKTKRITVVR